MPPATTLPERLVATVLGGGSAHVRPGPAVDGRAGGHVADAEFGAELPVSQALCPACPQFPYFSAGQFGPGIALAGSAVVVTMAFAASRLESDPEVIAGRIDRRPILGWPTAIGARVIAGRSAGFGHPAMPPGVGGVRCLPGGPGELVPARAGAAAVVAADHGECPADRAALLLVFGRAPGAPARLGVAGDKRAEARGDLVAAIAPAPGRPVAPAVRAERLHFGDDGEPAVFFPRIDDVPHDPDGNR